MFEFERPYLLQDKTPRQSQVFGRHIYLLEQAGQHYWLKLQLPYGDTQFQQGFSCESFSLSCDYQDSQLSQWDYGKLIFIPLTSAFDLFLFKVNDYFCD